MVAIKLEAPANHWEFYILGQALARLEPRDLQSIVGTRRFYAFQDEGLLLLEWGEKRTLLEIVNQAKSAGIAPAGTTGGGVEGVLAMFFTIELLRLVEGLHQAQLMHGDLNIDNCPLRLDETPGSSVWSNGYKSDGTDGWSSKGLFLVNFGRSIDFSILPRSQKFVAGWETDGRDCIEMHKARLWTYEVDYDGMASVAFGLPFGNCIKTTSEIAAGGVRRLRIALPLKNYWQADLWTRLFDICLNPCEVQSDVSLPMTDELATVRTEMQRWLSGNSYRGGKNL